MNVKTRLFSIALGAASLAGAATAQLVMHNNSAEDYVAMHESERLYWPAGPTPNFKRTVAGDFRAEQSLDVAVLAGDSVHLWHDASYSNLRVELVASDVNDIDTAPQGVGLADGLAIVRSTGLFLVTLPVNPSDPPVITAVATSNPSVWNGAGLVRALDYNADGVTDYVGLASDGVTILRLLGGSGGATESFVSPHTVHDLGVMLWDLDSARELAVATSSGTFIHELVGATVWAPATTMDSGKNCFTLTVLRGVGRDRVAWALDVGSEEEIHVARIGFAVEVVTLQLGTEVVGLSAADGDGDGDIDIVFNTRAHLAPVYLRNHNPAIPAFATSIAWGAAVVDSDVDIPTWPASNNTCAPLFRDFDYDGKADLFLALPQTSTTLNQSPAGVYMPWTNLPGIPVEVDWLSGGMLSQHANPGVQLRTLHLKLAPTILPEGNNEQANALEVLVYRQEQAGGLLEPSVLAWQLYRCDSFGPSDSLRVSVSFQDDTCFTGTGGSDSKLYWFEIWPRRVDWSTGPSGNPPVIRNYARRFVGVGANDEDVCEYLIGGGGLAGAALYEGTSASEEAPASCSGSEATLDCVEGPGNGTTQGPAAVIRVRLPERPVATEMPTSRTLVECGSAMTCVY